MTRVAEDNFPYYFCSKDGGEVLHVNAPMVKSRAQLEHMRGKKFSSVKVNGDWRTEDLAKYAADVLGPLTRPE